MERPAGLAHGDTPQAKLDKLDALLAQTSTSIEGAALLAEMLSLSNDGRYPALVLDPRRQRTLEALIAQIAILTRQSRRRSSMRRSDPGAPPCIRQRLLPVTAGDRHGIPERVLAPHRAAWTRCEHCASYNPKVPTWGWWVVRWVGKDSATILAFDAANCPKLTRFVKRIPTCSGHVCCIDLGENSEANRGSFRRQAITTKVMATSRGERLAPLRTDDVGK
jgi:hypothetical protein